MLCALLSISTGAGAQAPPAAAPVEPTPSPQPDAAPGPRIVWNEAWPRFRPLEYAYTAVVVGTTLYLEFGTNGASGSHWQGPILLDKPVRSGLVLGTPSARDRANSLSDIFTFIPEFYPLLDPLLVPLLGGTFDAAWQMEAMYFEVMGSVFFLARVGERYVARTRPATLECEKDPKYSDRCTAGPYAGFPSGHAAVAFAGAGLVCAHHTNLPLYGGGIPDYAVCGGMLAAATTTSVLRLMADRHYLSDVLVGAAMGLGLGYGGPELLHYRWPLSATSTRLLPGARVTAVPMGSSATMGMSLIGMF